MPCFSGPNTSAAAIVPVIVATPRAGNWGRGIGTAQYYAASSVNVGLPDENGSHTTCGPRRRSGQKLER
jgi:hypothetical protein